jgi:hypothetical protein
MYKYRLHIARLMWGKKIKQFTKIIFLVGIFLLSFNISHESITIQVFIDDPTPINKVVNTYPIDSLNSLMMAEISARTIVMLADAYHGHNAYLKLVTDFLNYWLDQIQNDPANLNVPPKLCLVLENFPETGKIFNRFFETGNQDSLNQYLTEHYVKYSWLFATTDYIEFLYNLRDIYQTTQNLKKSGKNIDLQFLYPERDCPFRLNVDSTLSESERKVKEFYWFADERDQIIANNITSYLKTHPDYKCLVFYGSPHLIRTKVDQSRVYKYPGKSYYQFFLAHYLDKMFGRKNISIFQTGYSANVDISKLYSLTNSADYLFNVNIFPDEPFPIFTLKTKARLALLLNLLEKLGKENELSNLDYINTCVHLISNYHQGSKFYSLSPLEWRLKYFNSMAEWNLSIPSISRGYKRDIAKLNAVKSILELDKWIVEENIPNKSKYIQAYENALSNLSGTLGDSLRNLFHSNSLSVWPTEHFSMPDRLQIEHYKNELIQYLLINMLWISTPDEKHEALDYLQKKTGQTFTSRREWAVWWRQQYNH